MRAGNAVLFSLHATHLRISGRLERRRGRDIACHANENLDVRAEQLDSLKRGQLEEVVLVGIGLWHRCHIFATGQEVRVGGWDGWWRQLVYASSG